VAILPALSLAAPAIVPGPSTASTAKSLRQIGKCGRRPLGCCGVTLVSGSRTAIDPVVWRRRRISSNAAPSARGVEAAMAMVGPPVDENRRPSRCQEERPSSLPELQDMHMQPGLERGLALREKLAPTIALEPSRQSASDTPISTRARNRQPGSRWAEQSRHRAPSGRSLANAG
jgi:hypothetical protein